MVVGDVGERPRYEGGIAVLAIDMGVDVLGAHTELLGQLRLEAAVKGGRPDRQKLAVEMALEEWGGSREKAAQALGISKATLWRWMKKYGIE